MNVRTLVSRATLPLLLTTLAFNSARASSTATLGQATSVQSTCNFAGSTYSYVWTELIDPNGVHYKDTGHLPRTTITGTSTTNLTFNVVGTWTFNQWSQQGQNGTPTIGSTNTIAVTSPGSRLTITCGANGTSSPAAGTYANLTALQSLTATPSTNYQPQWEVTQNGTTTTTLGRANTALNISVDMSKGNATAAATFTLIQRTVSFTCPAVTKTYDGTAASVQITPSDPSAIYTVTFADGSSISGITGTKTVTGPRNVTGSGSYYCTVTGPDSTFLTGSPNSGTITINKAPLTVTASSPTITYSPTGNAIPAIGLSYSGFATGESASNLSTQPTGSTTATSVSNAGTYPTSASGAVASNYSFSYVGGTLTINKAAVAFSFSNKSYTYDGSSHSALVSPSPTQATYTSSLAGGPSAGSYTITADGNGNYTGHGQDTLTISKATPSISWSTPAPITYGTALSGTQLNATASVPGSFSYSPVSGTVLSVGSNTLTVTFTPTDSRDYNAASASVTLVVNKATPTFSWATPAAITYGTAISATQLNATASVPGNFSYSPSSGFVPHAGTQTLNGTFTPTDSADYTTASGSVSLVVNKAPLTVRANNAARPYGTANPTFTVSYSGFVNGDTSTSVTTTPSASSPATMTSPVGTYVITAGGGSSPDYTFTYNNGTLTVTKATPTITWSTPAAITYGTALSATQLNATPSVPGSFVYSPAPGMILPTGTQTLNTTFTPADVTDYTSATASVSLMVNPATVTVTAPSASRQYGAPNPTFTPTYTGFVNGETAASLTTAPTTTTPATTASNVGTYPITSSGGASPNYAFSYVTGILTVTPEPVTFTIKGTSATYDGTAKAVTVTPSDSNATYTTTYTGTGGTIYGPSPTAPSSAGTYSVVVTANGNYSGSDSATLMVAKGTPVLTWATPAAITYGTALSEIQLDATASVPGSFIYSPASGTILGAGTQPVSVTFTPTDSADYNDTSASVTLIINKATLTVTANNQSRTYGAANPMLTMNYFGFVNDDTSTSITPPSASTTANTTSPVGGYPITLSGGSAADYTLTLVAGALTVTRAPLMVTACNQSRAYNTVNPPLTYVLGGFLNGDTASVVSGSPSVTTTAITTSAVGVYPITCATGTFSAANYVLSAFVPGSLTVTKVTPTITWTTPAAITYGTALSSTQLNAVAKDPDGNSISGTFAYSPASGIVLGAGSQTLSATFTPTDATDYDTVGGSAQLMVNKAALTVIANDASKTYGAANPTLTCALFGYVNGDTSAVVSGSASVTTAATNSSEVGTYAITPAIGTLAAANYVFGPFINGALSVTPATLTVTANNASKIYGSQNPTFSASYSGFVNGDTPAVVFGAPAFSTSATTSAAVGTYSITPAAGTLAAANYVFGSFVSGTLAVTPARLTVTPDSQTRAFGMPNPPLTYRLSGFAAGDSSASISGAPILSTSATESSDVGNYPVNAANGTLSAPNYQVYFDTGWLTVTGRPVTFAFSNLNWVYDGTAKAATVTPSDPEAAFSAVTTGGPDAGTYTVSATANHNWVGSGSATIVITPADQTITLTPASTTVFAGQPITVSATGGANAYSWGGSAGAKGTAGNVTLTLANPGVYTVSVYNNASNNFYQSNTATATITVTSNHVVSSLTPIASTYTVDDPKSPMNGQSYGRLWNDSGWTAYLGRAGVKFKVQAQAYPSVKTIELQAKYPGGAWSQLAMNNPSDGAINEDVTFSVMLDSTVPGQPLVPLSYSNGNPLTGAWSFRARVQDANGDWSDFSDEVQVNAILPIATKTVSGQTVPPAGPLGDWFTASEVKTWSIPLWIP